MKEFRVFYNNRNDHRNKKQTMFPKLIMFSKVNSNQICGFGVKDCQGLRSRLIREERLQGNRYRFRAYTHPMRCTCLFLYHTFSPESESAGSSVGERLEYMEQPF